MFWHIFPNCVEDLYYWYMFFLAGGMGCFPHNHAISVVSSRAFTQTECNSDSGTLIHYRVCCGIGDTFGLGLWLNAGALFLLAGDLEVAPTEPVATHCQEVVFFRGLDGISKRPMIGCLLMLDVVLGLL